MPRPTWAAALCCAMLLALAASAAAQGVEPLQVVGRNYMLPISGPQGTRMALLDAASVQWTPGSGSAAQAQAAQVVEQPVLDAAMAQQLADLPSTLSQPDEGASLCRRWRSVVEEVAGRPLRFAPPARRKSGVTRARRRLLSISRAT